MNKILFLIPIVILIISGILAYNMLEQDLSQTIIETNPIEEYTNEIRIGTIGEDAVSLIHNFQPVADYLALKLSVDEKYEGKVVIAKNMGDMIELINDQEIDLFVDSPITAVIISEQTESDPILRRWKDGVSEYHSVFFSIKDSGISINELFGKTIIFENRESSSGYFLPKSFLIENGVNLKQGNDNFDSMNYVFAGEDVNIPLWLLQDKGDVGVVSNIAYVEISEVYDDKFIILFETESIPRHIVIQRSDIDSILSEKIKQILINMDEDEEGIKILKDFKNTKKFDDIPNKDEFLENIMTIISNIN